MQNSMYSHMRLEFIPISSTGSASDTNSFSISTTSVMISTIRPSGRRLTILEYSKHAKSQCNPSSRLMSSFEKHSPGMRPLFLSQTMAQKDPEKIIPSTAEKAKDAWSASHHRRAQLAFLLTHGTVSIAHSKCIFSF